MKITYKEFRQAIEAEVAPDGYSEELFKHFSIGPGWHQLVKDLIVSLFRMEWDGGLLQVKEKFGGLRFYLENYTSETQRLVNEAEWRSTTICDVCGNPGIIRGNGWLRCRCDEHDTGRPWGESV